MIPGSGRHRAWALACFLFVGSAPVAAGIDEPASPAHPNVLLVIGDDFGVDRVGCYAVPDARPAPTPVIDGLAARGVRFTRAYSQCVCSPSRAALLTGRQAFRTGIGAGVPFRRCEKNPNGCFDLDTSELVTLPQALADTHATAAFGKWHLAREGDGSGYGHPVEVGFDHFAGAAQNLGGSEARFGGRAKGPYSRWVRNVAEGSGGVVAHAQAEVDGYATSVNVDDALAWIGARGDAPWFVWLAFNSAHEPLHVPPEELLSEPVTPKSSETDKHRAMVEALDTELGRLLDGIAPEVLANTWVVFLADNGDPSSSLPRRADGSWPARAKPRPWEGNVRVPLIVTGPGVARPGSTSDQVTHLVDVVATVCGLAGVASPPTAVDSVDLGPVLRGEGGSGRAVAYGERFRPNGHGPYNLVNWYVTDGRWKLGKWTNRGEGGPDHRDPELSDEHMEQLQLFDLDVDLFEEHDLLDGELDEEAQAALERLLAERRKLLAR